MNRLSNANGQSVVEFVMILPILLIIMISVFGITKLCIRGELVDLATSRAARAGRFFDDQLVARELYAILTPEFSNRGWIEWSDGAGNVRLRNWDVGKLNVHEIFDSNLLPTASLIKKGNAVVPALVKDLSDDVLRGGDSPSPYCRDGEGYAICGYVQ